MGMRIDYAFHEKPGLDEKSRNELGSHFWGACNAVMISIFFEKKGVRPWLEDY
jgi:hypothetical protein